MFDSIITEADRKFNLNGKAGTLLSALLSLMTDGSRGGFAGFLDRFKQAGVSDTAASWTNSGANAEISNEQLESALGADTLRGISNQAGIEYNTAASAAAFMTPRVIDALTPDGVVPQDSDLLSRIGGFLSGDSTTTAPTVGETFDRVGSAAAPTLDAEKGNAGNINIADQSAYPVGDRGDASLKHIDDDYDDKDESPLKWLLPLILLALLLITGYWFCSKSPEPAKTASPTVNTNTAVTNAVNQ